MAERTDLAFAAALRALMAERGVSVRQLAALTPLGSGRVGNLLTGYGSPTVENMVQIAEALGVDPAVFCEYREHLVTVKARRLTRLHGADAVLAKLDELD